MVNVRKRGKVFQYQIEGSEMFDEMINDIKLDVVKIILAVQKREGYERRSNVQITEEGREDISGIITPEEAEAEKERNKKKAPIVNDGPKVGRNDPCPCGSGKKYKNCCGKNQ